MAGHCPIAPLLSRQAKTFNRRVGSHKNELLPSWLVLPLSLGLSELRTLEVKGFHQFDPWPAFASLSIFTGTLLDLYIDL